MHGVERIATRSLDKVAHSVGTDRGQPWHAVHDAGVSRSQQNGTGEKNLANTDAAHGWVLLPEQYPGAHGQRHCERAGYWDRARLDRGSHGLPVSAVYPCGCRDIRYTQCRRFLHDPGVVTIGVGLHGAPLLQRMVCLVL
jgi:hypothetical protein